MAGARHRVRLGVFYGYRAGFVDWIREWWFHDLRVEVRKARLDRRALDRVHNRRESLALNLLPVQAATSDSVVGPCRGRCRSLLLIGSWAPTAELLVMQSFIWCVYKWGRLPWSLAGPVAAVLLLSIAVLGVVRQGGDTSPEMVVSRALWRPFVNFQNLQTVVDAYPAVIEYERGGTFVADLRVLLPAHEPNYGTLLKEKLDSIHRRWHHRDLPG